MNKCIHPRVGYTLARTKKGPNARLKYTPIGMDEKKFFRRKNTDGGLEYSIDGVVLPDYVLESHKNWNGPLLQTFAVEGDEAGKYLKDLYGVPLHEY